MVDKNFHELVHDMRRVRIDELALAVTPTFDKAAIANRDDAAEEARARNFYFDKHYAATGQPAEREDHGWI